MIAFPRVKTVSVMHISREFNATADHLALSAASRLDDPPFSPGLQSALTAVLEVSEVPRFVELHVLVVKGVPGACRFQLGIG